MNTLPFQPGDRVRLKPLACVMWPLKSRSGQVVSVIKQGKGAGRVRVRRDGLKTAETWSPDVWERDGEQANDFQI